MQIENQIQTLNWHPARRWSMRDVTTIQKIILHQELGESTVEQVNAYHIGPNHISQRGCPHFCYHYGIEKDGRIIMANDLCHIVWHCKGQNSIAVGIMLVGNFNGPGYNLGTEGPTGEQMESVDFLVNHLLEELKLNRQNVYGHYHFGKPACPGYKVQRWIEDFRDDPEIESWKEDTKKSVKDIQSRLKKLGYYDGKIDGVIGVKSQSAIRAFQKSRGLQIDGIVGPNTLKALFNNQ